MIDDVNPLPFRIVFPSAFPVLGMYEMNASVFVRFPSSFSPIEILIPFDARLPQAIEFTHERHGAAKIQHTILMEKQ
jgi:hypothetical protein